MVEKGAHYAHDYSSYTLCPLLSPRQFEYHPQREDTLVLGTTDGELAVVNHDTGDVISASRLTYSCLLHHKAPLACAPRRRRAARAPAHGSTAAPGLQDVDSVLGLCWLRHNPDWFVAGSSRGRVEVCNYKPVRPCAPKSQASAAEGTPEAHARPAAAQDSPTIHSAPFEKFSRLTSVHVNSTDQVRGASTRGALKRGRGPAFPLTLQRAATQLVVVSGYSRTVRAYDLATSQVVRTFNNIHSDHINITRFAYHSPHVLSTTSFDRTVKLWDMREPGTKPIYVRAADPCAARVSDPPPSALLPRHGGAADHHQPAQRGDADLQPRRPSSPHLGGGQLRVTVLRRRWAAPHDLQHAVPGPGTPRGASLPHPRPL